MNEPLEQDPTGTSDVSCRWPDRRRTARRVARRRYPSLAAALGGADASTKRPAGATATPATARRRWEITLPAGRAATAATARGRGTSTTSTPGPRRRRRRRRQRESPWWGMAAAVEQLTRPATASASSRLRRGPIGPPGASRSLYRHVRRAPEEASRRRSPGCVFMATAAACWSCPWRRSSSTCWSRPGRRSRSRSSWRTRKNYMTAGGIWAPLVGTFCLVWISLMIAAPVGRAGRRVSQRVRPRQLVSRGSSTWPW